MGNFSKAPKAKPAFVGFWGFRSLEINNLPVFRAPWPFDSVHQILKGIASRRVDNHCH